MVTTVLLVVMALVLGLVAGLVLGITFAARNIVEAAKRVKEQQRAVAEELDR